MILALKEFHLTDFLMKNSWMYRTWKAQGTRKDFEVNKTIEQYQNWIKIMTEIKTQLTLLEYGDILMTLALILNYIKFWKLGFKKRAI